MLLCQKIQFISFSMLMVAAEVALSLDKLQGLTLSLGCWQRLEVPKHIPDHFFKAPEKPGSDAECHPHQG